MPLDDAAVADRLTRLDDALGRLERTPGATAETALDAVTMLTEVYGEALARTVARLPGDAAASLPDDELVGHLLALHGLHPEPAERRVTRALDRLRPELERHGLDVKLTGIDAGTARVGLRGGGCGCGAETVRDAVREAVFAAAPELESVEVSSPRAAAFVPVDALMRRPAPAAGGAA